MKNGLKLFIDTYDTIGYIVDDGISGSDKVQISAVMFKNKKSEGGKAAFGIAKTTKRSNECAVMVWKMKYPGNDNFRLINFNPAPLNEILKVLGEKI